MQCHSIQQDILYTTMYMFLLLGHVDKPVVYPLQHALVTITFTVKLTSLVLLFGVDVDQSTTNSQIKVYATISAMYSFCV